MLCHFFYHEVLSVTALCMTIRLLFLLCLFLRTWCCRFVCCYSQSYLVLPVSGSWSCWWAGNVKAKCWPVVRYCKLHFVLTSSIYLKRLQYILFIRLFIIAHVHVSYVKQFEGVYSLSYVVDFWVGYVLVFRRRQPDNYRRVGITTFLRAPLYCYLNNMNWKPLSKYIF